MDVTTASDSPAAAATTDAIAAVSKSTADAATAATKYYFSESRPDKQCASFPSATKYSSINLYYYKGLNVIVLRPLSLSITIITFVASFPIPIPFMLSLMTTLPTVPFLLRRSRAT